MILVDVNVLLYAHREEFPDHQAYRDWLTAAMNGEAAYGMSELVLSSFIRIITNAKVFRPPTPLGQAIEAANVLRTHPSSIPVAPGPMHWDIFMRLCRETGAKGSHVTDAYLAALAIEAGAEWITTDRDFSRFPGLRWRHPLS
ncbi:MAG: type II toxin-antitoxin system VapC family toxin [Chloroflexi bacterium]|nr:type II toxin-antitoxin system VapC family toxin [Chloroflexota bacterium]